MGDLKYTSFCVAIVVALATITMAQVPSAKSTKFGDVTLTIGMKRGEVRSMVSAKFEIREFTTPERLQNRMEIIQKNAGPQAPAFAVLLFSDDKLKSITRRWNTGKPDSQYGFSEALMEALHPVGNDRPISCELYLPNYGSAVHEITISCEGSKKVEIYSVNESIPPSIYEEIQ